jgi:hypothetical protein
MRRETARAGSTASKRGFTMKISKHTLIIERGGRLSDVVSALTPTVLLSSYTIPSYSPIQWSAPLHHQWYRF